MSGLEWGKNGGVALMLLMVPLSRRSSVSIACVTVYKSLCIPRLLLGLLLRIFCLLL